MVRKCAILPPTIFFIPVYVRMEFISCLHVIVHLFERAHVHLCYDWGVGIQKPSRHFKNE